MFVAVFAIAVALAFAVLGVTLWRRRNLQFAIMAFGGAVITLFFWLTETSFWMALLIWMIWVMGVGLGMWFKSHFPGFVAALGSMAVITVLLLAQFATASFGSNSATALDNTASLASAVEGAASVTDVTAEESTSGDATTDDTVSAVEYTDDNGDTRQVPVVSHDQSSDEELVVGLAANTEEAPATLADCELPLESTQELVKCVNESSKGDVFIDYVNTNASALGFNWDDVLDAAETDVDYRVITVSNKADLSLEEARQAVVDAGEASAKDVQKMKVFYVDGTLINTRGGAVDDGYPVEEFGDARQQVLVNFAFGGEHYAKAARGVAARCSNALTGVVKQPKPVTENIPKKEEPKKEEPKKEEPKKEEPKKEEPPTEEPPTEEPPTEEPPTEEPKPALDKVIVNAKCEVGDTGPADIIVKNTDDDGDQTFTYTIQVEGYEDRVKDVADSGQWSERYPVVQIGDWWKVWRGDTLIDEGTFLFDECVEEEEPPAEKPEPAMDKVFVDVVCTVGTTGRATITVTNTDDDGDETFTYTIKVEGYEDRTDDVADAGSWSEIYPEVQIGDWYEIWRGDTLIFEGTFLFDECVEEEEPPTEEPPTEEPPTEEPPTEEPCPYNPELPKDSPDCKEPPAEEVCEFNPELPPGHPDCVNPKDGEEGPGTPGGGNEPPPGDADPANPSEPDPAQPTDSPGDPVDIPIPSPAQPTTPVEPPSQEEEPVDPVDEPEYTEDPDPTQPGGPIEEPPPPFEDTSSSTANMLTGSVLPLGMLALLSAAALPKRRR